MPKYQRYDAAALEPLRHQDARRFLQDVGLPREHLLFAFAEPGVRTVAVNGSERRLLKIGEGGDVEEFCVDVESGEVVVLNTADSSVWHVNAAPDTFAASLEEFTSRFPYGDQETDLPEREALAQALGRALVEIDGTALREDPGYWHTILGDVAIGDYVDD
jgi:hypothetical protein